MTTIETDNPIIEMWVKYYDILWHYWPVVLLAFILGVWLMFRHFSRRQKEWELNKQQMRRKKDEMREQIRKYSSPIERKTMNRIDHAIVWLLATKEPLYEIQTVETDTEDPDRTKFLISVELKENGKRLLVTIEVSNLAIENLSFDLYSFIRQKTSKAVDYAITHDTSDDLYEKDVIEIKTIQVKPITPHKHV
jgi:hypothetical protein